MEPLREEGVEHWWDGQMPGLLWRAQNWGTRGGGVGVVVVVVGGVCVCVDMKVDSGSVSGRTFGYYAPPRAGWAVKPRGILPQPGWPEP